MAGTTRTRKTAAAKTEAATTEATAATTEATVAQAVAAPEGTVPAEATPAPEEGTVPAEAAPAPEETTPAEPTPAADSTPKAPDAAPLEPPLVHEPPEAPAEHAYATPTEVIPDDENLSDVIVDDATKEPPADVDAVFVPVTPYGSTLLCTVRLIEKTFFGPHKNPITRLLQPAGAHVSEPVAARIKERLVAQAERLAAQTESTDE